MSTLHCHSLLGQENGLKLAYLHKLKQKVINSKVALESHRFYGHEVDEARLLSLLQSASLFGELPWIEVVMSEHIKKSELKGLVAFIKNKAHLASGYLLFLSDETKLDKGLDAVIPSKNRKVFNSLSEEELASYVSEYLMERQFTIEAAALDLLLTKVESDTQALARILDLLMQNPSCQHNLCVDEQSVQEYVDQTKEVDAHDLFMTLASRDLSTTLDRFEQLLHTKDGVSVITLIVLNRSFKGVMDYVSLCEQGYDSNEALKQLRIFYQRAQATKLAANHYSKSDLHAILAMAPSYDLAARDGNKEFVKEVITHYLIACCTTAFTLY